MNLTRLHETLLRNPELFLALTLSVPISSRSSLSSVTVDFREHEVIARIPNTRETVGPRIIPTKQTILAAISLLDIIYRRDSKFADTVIDRAISFAEEAASYNLDTDYVSQETSSPFSPAIDTMSFFNELGIDAKEFDQSKQKTDRALQFLEDEGLVIDPGFTPEMMVFAGFIPMHFSVRTPKGEQIYREIKVNAPLWSLEIIRRNQNEDSNTDFEFRFRGIEIVKNAITALATQYLRSEEDTRAKEGQPLLHRNGPPELDSE